MATLADRRPDPAVDRLQAQAVLGRTQPHRRYDFRPPPTPNAPRRIHEPWRLARQAKLETPVAKTRYRLRGIATVASAWTLIALACNCKRLHRLHAA